MTKKAKKEDVFLEGNRYFLLVEVFVLTEWNRHPVACQTLYGKQAAYFRFQYPAGWLAGISLVCWGYWLVAVVLSDGEKRFSVRNDMDGKNNRKTIYFVDLVI